MAHALLGASSAARWLACPPSARLTEQMPDKQTEFTREGTFAHKIAENRLLFAVLVSKGRFDDPYCGVLGEELEKLKADPEFKSEMLHYVGIYVDEVMEKYFEAKRNTKDALIMVEAKLDYSAFVPDGFGTGDAVIIADGRMEVIDFKYGQGVPVYAFKNPQMRLYAAGAMQEYGFMYAVKEVRTTIIQPRLDHISSESMDLEELEQWLHEVVAPKAMLAYKGKGEYQPGKHCQFCKARAQCKTRANANMGLLDYGFKHAELMTNAELGPILAVADELAAWVKHIKDYAFDELTQGREVPGWKLVEGRSNRTIANKADAMEALELAIGEHDTEDCYLKPRELRGIGELEKHFGKKRLAEILGDLIEKPPGKPTMVMESDKKPAIDSLAKDFENEDFDM